MAVIEGFDPTGVTSGVAPTSGKVTNKNINFAFTNPATAGNINLSLEGKGNPGTAPGGLRKTSRVYFRKVDLTDGVELKSSFGDVNVGNSTTCVVKGGPYKTIYYSNYTLPSKPSYGESKLVGLYAGIPVQDVGRGSLSSVPNFNIWKGKTTSFTDGSCTVDESPIAAFMSHIDSGPQVYEGFEGAVSTPGMSRRVGNRVVTKMQSYLPADWAYANIATGTRQGLSDYNDFLDRYCDPVMGVPSGYACPVRETSFSVLATLGNVINPYRWGDVGKGLTTTFEPTKGKEIVDLIEPVWDSVSVRNAGYPLEDKIDVVVEDVNMVTDINSNNSIFSVTTNNINAAASDDAPIYEASARFSGDRVLTGTYSAKLRTYWANSVVSIGNVPDIKDSGATNRQEVIMQYGPMPYPTVMDMEASTQNETAYRIGFDLFIDKLAAAWSGGSGVDEDRLTRGLIVTMSDTQYTRSDGTLYDWIKAKDDGTDEFAYFAILNSSQDSANAADADHAVYLIGSDENNLGTTGASFDDDSSNKMIRVKSGIDPFATAGLNHTAAGGIPTGQWIHMDLSTIPYLYGWRLRATVPTPDGTEHTLAAFQLRTTDNSRQSSSSNWTPYIQFWLVNYPSDHGTDGAFSAAQDTESVVYIDNFSISNSNYNLENATVCAENSGFRSKLTFGAGREFFLVLSHDVFQESRFRVPQSRLPAFPSLSDNGQQWYL